MNMSFEDWNIKEMCGYEPKTTFYMDFSIAEKYGLKAIKDTFNNAFKHWKNNHIYLTELVMVLNWKLWRWENDITLYQLYYDLWSIADLYATTNLKDEELSYFYRTID